MMMPEKRSERRCKSCGLDLACWARGEFCTAFCEQHAPQEAPTVAPPEQEAADAVR
jgi:hypothetical protein